MLPRRTLVDSTLLRNAAGELPTTLGQTLSAVASDPLLRPTALIVENIEQSRFLPQINDPFVLTGELDTRPDPQVDMADPEEVSEEFSDIGLEIDAPTPRPIVEAMAKRREEQLIRDDIIARGPEGLLAKALQLGVALPVAAADPINIASAFVPVVGEARFAGIAARVGLTGARAAKGVTEGLVGASAVEPLTLALSDQVGLDYDMTDALVNVALGGILGGGLHVAGGTAADALRRRRTKMQPEITETATPETLEAALRTSVAHTVEGKDVEASGLFDADVLDTGRITDPGEPFEVRTEIERGDIASQQTFDIFDVDAARTLDEQVEIPAELPESARRQLDEADAFVADADNVRPALEEAGRCLGA